MSAFVARTSLLLQPELSDPTWTGFSVPEGETAGTQTETEKQHDSRRPAPA